MAIETKHGGQSACLVISHHELGRMNRKKQWPSGFSFGVRNMGIITVFICFFVAVINSIAKDKFGEKGVYFLLHLLSRGKSGQELKAGAVTEACLLLCSLEFV